MTVKKVIVTLAVCCISLLSSGQDGSKVSLYLSLYGIIPGNNFDRMENPFGGGIGAVLDVNTRSKFKPRIDLNLNGLISMGIVYIESTGKTAIGGPVTNLFAGFSYSAGKKTELSLVAGTGFNDSRVLPGFKPGIGIYPGKKKKLITEISYTTLFDTGHSETETLRFINIGIRIRFTKQTTQ